MDLQYCLISNKKFLTGQGLELRNQIYKMWKARWGQIYEEQGSEHHPTADDFVRHDFFSVLVSHGKLIGFSAHTMMDFQDQSTYDRDFFSMFTRSYSSALQKLGVNRVMTFESLMVDPELKRNPWELPLSRLIMRLNSYLLNLTSAEAMMAVARKDNGVSHNLELVGYRMVEANKDCRGFPCDLKTLLRGEHLEPIVDKTEPVALALWNKRQQFDGIEFLGNQQHRHLKVA